MGRELAMLALEENPFSCPSQLSAADIPWSTALYFISMQRYIALSFSSIVTSPSETLLPLSAIFKDSCDFIGPTWTVQGSLSVLSQLLSNLNSP